MARYEAHNYFVLEIDELYEAEERGSAARRFILNKSFIKKDIQGSTLIIGLLISN